MSNEIIINNKPCELMKPYKNPKYGTRTILTDSTWEYVALFLKRRKTAGSADALFYWKQAQSFYQASKALPDSASPLNSYYCILNASKALLRYHNISEDNLTNHGLSSVRNSEEINLKKSETAIKGAGVLIELSKYFESNLQPQHYCIYDLLYNIPCVHRAFCITYSKPEIFIPISNPKFVKNKDSKVWISFIIHDRYASSKMLASLPAKFEKDLSYTEKCVIRMKKRFKWDIHTDIEERKKILCNYHQNARKYLYYIHSTSKLWYIKRIVSTNNNQLQDISSAVLIFAVFHWLSELVRYQPKVFNKYMSSKQNWLLHEFINKALDQFVDEISSEITGEDTMCTGFRKV